MDENGEITAETAQAMSERIAAPKDEAIDMEAAPATEENKASDPTLNPFLDGQIRTLDGDIADDEFAADAMNYQVLLGKIEKVLEKLKLDA